MRTDHDIRAFLAVYGRMPWLGGPVPPWHFRGWLAFYVQEAHRLNVGGFPDRWGYLFHVHQAWGPATGEADLDPGPIPRVAFGHADRKVMSDLTKAVELAGATRYGGWGWSSFRLLTDWLAYGLGFEKTPPELDDATQEKLYRSFNLEGWFAHPHDYLATYVCEMRGNGWNPFAFHPTPHEVCEAIVQMTFGDSHAAEDDGPADSVLGASDRTRPGDRLHDLETVVLSGDRVRTGAGRAQAADGTHGRLGADERAHPGRDAGSPQVRQSAVLQPGAPVPGDARGQRGRHAREGQESTAQRNGVFGGEADPGARDRSPNTGSRGRGDSSGRPFDGLEPHGHAQGHRPALVGARQVGDNRRKTVCDPACGTGRMLLHASNHSLYLHGQDIDGLMVSCSLINGALYAPWIVAPPPRREAGAVLLPPPPTFPPARA